LLQKDGRENMQNQNIGDFSDQLIAMIAKSGHSMDSRDLFLPFWMHSLDTAGILQKIYYRWIPDSVFHALKRVDSEEFLKLLIFLGLVHDIGKITYAFQSRIALSVEGGIDHLEKAGLDFSSKLLYQKRSPHPLAGEAILLYMNCPVGVASIVGAYHGRPESIEDDPQRNLEYYPQNYYGNSKTLWEAMWREWMNFCLQYAGYSDVSELPELDMASEMLLTGLLIVGDWVASSTSFFPLVREEKEEGKKVYPTRVNMAWEQLHFPDAWKPQADTMGLERFHEEFGFLPNEVQQAMLNISESTPSPELMILEAYMGSGKTEAALSAAEVLAANSGSGGVFFGLPSQATANGLFPRIKSWAQSQSLDERHSIELMHGNAALNREFQSLRRYENLNADPESIGEDLPDDGVYLNNWFDSRKTGLLADFVIGTIDQYLMAGLKMKHVMMRMLGLAGKVVILDECHAYDAYMNSYFDRVLNWLGTYGVPVILLSATLPSERRKEMVQAYIRGKDRRKAEMAVCPSHGYPQITWTSGTNVYQKTIPITSKNRRVKVGYVYESQLVEAIKDRLADGGCAGIIVNTVRKAQEVMRLLQECLPEYDIALFHSAFTMQDRANRENALLARVGKKSTEKERDRFIAVGTQVLEQSLDLDFDFLVTQICPMDLFLQRIGRLHRHFRSRPKRMQEAECLLLFPENQIYDEGTKAVYGDWLLTRTYQELMSIPDFCIHIPDDIPVLVEKVYTLKDDLRPISEEEKKFLSIYENHIIEKRERARSYCLPEPQPFNQRHPALNSMAGLLDGSYGIDDEKGKAAVRDTGASIEVLLVRIMENGKAAFLPWIKGGKELSLNEPPDTEDAYTLLTQKIKLPYLFCLKWERTLGELEALQRPFSVWREANVLKDELFLPLDENLHALLINYQITYSPKGGLSYKKMEEDYGKTIQSS
jgi:CRISPR-associated endonuclease/helicase Cas3